MTITYRIKIKSVVDVDISKERNIDVSICAFGQYNANEKVFDLSDIPGMVYFIDGDCKIDNKIRLNKMILFGRSGLSIRSLGGECFGIQARIV